MYACLVSCTRHTAEYVYVQLVGDAYEILEVGEPPMIHERFSGDEIPIRYRVSTETGSIEVAIGNDAFVPNLYIQSTDMIREIDAGECASVIDRSDYEKVIFWPYWPPPEPSCVSEGDKIKVTIWLSGSTDSVVFEGAIAKSGAFYYYDSL